MRAPVTPPELWFPKYLAKILYLTYARVTKSLCSLSGGYLASMDFDDDAPPDLVEAGAGVDSLQNADEKIVKVPITIVTGTLKPDLIYPRRMTKLEVQDTSAQERQPCSTIFLLPSMARKLPSL